METFRTHLRVADRAAGRDNNFNLLRMLAAAGVLVSHAWPISLGADAEQPLSRLLGGIPLGTVSVMVFFSISGFFIARSFAQRRSLAGFLRARALRLFPALVVVLGVTVIVAGLALTTATSSDYWRSVPEYLARNLTLFFLKYDLPGVFDGNPYGSAINGSLWTLNYEVLCYAGVVLCGLTGLLARPRYFAVALGLFAVVYGATMINPLHPRIEALMLLALPFAIGMAFWVWRHEIPLSWRLALGLAVLAVLCRPTPLFLPALSLAISYTVLVAGYARNDLLAGYNRLGDYSYGTYVYAFPIQQVMASIAVMSPLLNIVLALPLTLVCAVLSWHLVEGPALRLRHAGIARPADGPEGAG